jgi:hypothetical protein
MKAKLNRYLIQYKPSVPVEYLFFIASAVWAFAGTMLLMKGLTPLLLTPDPLKPLLISIPAGILFYLLMFSRISAKHIFRIQNITIYQPCAFSFFDWKSYGMMTIMISAGIVMKKIHLIPLNYYYPFLVCMGIPLIISAFRFLSAGIGSITKNQKNV